MDNCIHLLFIHSFLLTLVVTRYPEILSDILGILYVYRCWNSLSPAASLVNSICTTIFVEILCDCRFYPIGSTYMLMLAIVCWFLKFVLLAQTSLRTWAGSRPIKPWLIVRLCLICLIIFWSKHLVLIFRCGNHIFLCILYSGLFRCFHNPMSLHSFFSRWTLM